MRKYSLRNWFLWICIPTLFVIPIFLAFLSANWLQHVENKAIQQINDHEENQRQWLLEVVGGEINKWENLNWQQQLIPELAKRHIDLRLITPEGKLALVYSTEMGETDQQVPVTLHELETPEHGLIYYYYPPPYVAITDKDQPIQQLPFVIWIVSFLGIIFYHLWYLKRSLLTPIIGIQKANQQIAKQNLNFTLPNSQIEEVEELLHSVRSMQSALATSISKQAKLEEERNLTLASLVHDFRTPLFTLANCLTGIRSGIVQDPDKKERYLEICQDKIAYLQQLLHHLQEYQKYAPLSLTEKEPVDVRALVERLLIGFQRHIEQKKQHLRWESPDEPIIIMGKNHLLERVFQNVLDNAHHYTPAEGTIWVKVQKIHDQVVIIVEDNGPGVPKEQWDNIFQPFIRLDTARGTYTGGSGLGLAIVQKGVKLHGGSVSVESGEMGGLKVEIRLAC
ncbi:sensor histidine kinase [Risungbinella massiliensis]|uniref:sensor histidine kinase n=1 Tax=Risungbinella massiliensis TaxID=1329796 RepID=UPI0005CB8418|nr:HAMP domain-containing sensor histidine kinase [Risungbinella massiliensis]